MNETRRNKRNRRTTKFYSKMEQTTPNSSSKEDMFMTKFKYYKSNKFKPSLIEVISAENCCGTDKIINRIPDSVIEDPRTKLLGLQELAQWQKFMFPKHPGLFLVKNPFTSLGERYWIRKCLEEYPRKPNKLNIDIEVSTQDWWAECFENGQYNYQLQKKLRWTTLGYHHNWDTKIYSEENKNVFPEDLAELCDVIAKYFGYERFGAEAAIVNYYHMSSTLSAHTDHSEMNLDAPLFSFSFGQSAIFLLGGKDKSVEPSAILLNSGDVVIMSKEARLCYHAVPKIIPAPVSSWKEKCEWQRSSIIPKLKYIRNPKEIIKIMNENADDSEWRRFNKYITESRININVRQVLYEKQKSLTDSLFIDM